MTDKIQLLTGEQIKEFLPDALRKALSSYHAFIERAEFALEKDFSKDHTACKVAISHIELLIKLGRLAYAEEENSMDSALMKAAQQDIENFYNSVSGASDDLA